ncbi:GlcG/HbpS family heme-binding protein [Pseudoxanthomonas suwonensis]|uniref:GlcG/HbpS family heme-binding protein n=1 Tax=Pseudoxanthomonas suwonensis TaxID=314722 RepID=UPI00048BE576|nr:heme-binding protein [Pseudoxanthomonas suwonensis]
MKATLPVVVAVAASLGAAIAPLHAQSLRPALDFATADAIRDHCLAAADRAGYTVAVAVFDAGGDLVSFGKDRTSPAAGAVAQWKGRSAAIYGYSTAQTATWNIPAAPMISTAQGGVPIFTTDGQDLGGVGVSGAPSEFDEACGTAAVQAAGLRVTRP